MDNFVYNLLLTVGKARSYGGFNKLPIWKAKYKAFKINDLEKYENEGFLITSNISAAAHNDCFVHNYFQSEYKSFLLDIFFAKTSMLSGNLIADFKTQNINR